MFSILENGKIAVVYVREVDNAKIFGKTKKYFARATFVGPIQKIG